MRKFARNLALAVMLATTCGALAHADDIPTGTDPIPPTHTTGSSSTTTSTIAIVMEILSGGIL